MSDFQDAGGRVRFVVRAALLLGLAGALVAACGTASSPGPLVAGEGSAAPSGAAGSARPEASFAAPSASSKAPDAGPCAIGAVIDPVAVTDGVPGSFSAAGLDERVGQAPCPSATGNRALLRRVGHAWTIAQIAEVDGRKQRVACRAVRAASGRDLLVCREVLHVRSVRRESLVVYDYAQPGDEGLELFAATDTTGAACSGAREVAAVRLGDLVAVDVDGDGDLDLRVALHAGRVRVARPPTCDASGSAQPALADPRARSLELLLEGERLTPTGATARLVASLESELPEP